MGIIKVMDEDLANKIAAGEVVEKCMNVVKELVENSIDASSDEIIIRLEESGINKIEVEDNGIGMDKEDAKCAFLRHATSKLSSVEDLFYISSLGFRGEALPSIASISKIRLKTSNGIEGCIINIDGGEIKSIKSSDLSKGTKITVENLFYNTPVRLKYLKNPYIELSYIVDYINKMALSYPSIKFILINNGKELLHTSGDGNLLKVIYSIYGSDITKKMIDISGENDDYYISGYISYPEIAKSSKSSITILVNGRVIKNNRLNKIITLCYDTYIPKGKTPIVILNIDVDPILIDVNIHPTKMDIKFSKMEVLEELIKEVISKRLKEINLIPSISTRDYLSTIEVIETNKNIINNNFEDKKDNNTNNITYEEIKLDLNIEEDKEDYEHVEFHIKEMIPKCIIFLTYIICENEDGMYIVDQHAAAERVNYEKIMDSFNNNIKKYDLLVPIKIELKKDEILIIKDRLDILNDLGFEIEEFGDNTIIIRTYPSFIKENMEEEVIRSLIDKVIEDKSFEKEKFIWRMVSTIACRMSVKANDYLSLEDAKYILDNLRKCKNPFTCPHGRPTIISYTKYELEKLFKRVM